MTGGQEQREAVLLAWLLVKVVALKIDTVVAVPELLREEVMLALPCFWRRSNGAASGSFLCSCDVHGGVHTSDDAGNRNLARFRVLEVP